LAFEIRPYQVSLVPEKRQEITTEGGLDVCSQEKALSKIREKMQDKGVLFSLFIDPDLAQVDASQRIQADSIEINTGKYTELKSPKEIERELERIKKSAKRAAEQGLKVFAGHGLNYENVTAIAAVPEIEELNNDNKVSAILVQLPLPKHIDKRKVIETIDPGKDVDGFHPMNVGNLSSGYDSSIPCTPFGCSLLIKQVEKNLSGKHAIVIGRSNLNGKPMTQLLLKENCTVTITHSKTKDLKTECLRADIIIAAVGIPKLVKGDWVKKGAIVIDVGINKTDSGLVGDVDFDAVSKVAKAITPVPGGVGPMTIACLLNNTVECFKKTHSK